MRLNLGCGTAIAQGWINIDRSPNLLLDRLPRIKRTLRTTGWLKQEHMTDWPKGIVRLDVTKGLPYEPGSVEAIYSSHMLEHLYMDDARTVLHESFRVLRPGGVIRLALPDVEAMLRSFLRAREEGEVGAGRRFNLELNTHAEDRPTLRGKAQTLMSGKWHRWQPTRDLVFELLAEAGFSSATERNFREGALPELEAVEHREESFFVEASR